MVTTQPAQPAQRDGASLLLSLTRDPARIEARLRQAALLEAADVPAPLVRALVKITTTGRLTLEDILVLRDTGIDIDGMAAAIQRADHTLRTTQDHATTPRSAQDSNRVAQGGEGESRPAERRWRIRRYGAMWRAVDPNCRGRDEDGCRITTTWTDAVAHVNTQLRARALTAIENQEATNQPQEDQC